MLYENNHLYYKILLCNIPIIYLLFKYSDFSFEKYIFVYIAIQAVVFFPNRGDICAQKNVCII